ncbi:low molecular weight protein-tyrosine-phosphatase [Streptobacillus canis]|uniref:low molecular weight protein-tyrosine-phosphatase n=1 Tax=Streptobacillus canis TaxID=2678686 RepID=UPI0012E230E9|nr:low molecular weight protein-tyrosine-phosphatase [Streptobacillus canis]
MKKVLFVCHGNICRSTMAESVFTHMINEKGLKDKFMIDSAGTSSEEIGNSPHHGTVKKLKEKGILVVPHKARQITLKDFHEFDYIIAMDSYNVKNIERFLGKKSGKVFKLLDFTGNNLDIEDPWHTRDFEETFKDICRGLAAFLLKIENIK